MSYLFPKWKKNEILNWRQRFEKSHYAVLVSTFFQPPVAPVEITYNFNLSTHQFLGSPENPPEWSPVSQKKPVFWGGFPEKQMGRFRKTLFFWALPKMVFFGCPKSLIWSCHERVAAKTLLMCHLVWSPNTSPVEHPKGIHQLTLCFFLSEILQRDFPAFK